MKKRKISGSALFMYIVIFVTLLTCAICFSLYYGGKTENGAVLWSGVTAFMIVYHFWGRIILGNVTKLFEINQNHWWFKEKKFEKGLYKLLSVEKWKDKALTYNPEAFSMKAHTLPEIAAVMTKSEVDHWVNEVISLVSILFSLVWGEAWIFAITAVFAMLFDAQFIIIQRYNRPRVLRLIEKKSLRAKKKTSESPSKIQSEVFL